VRRVTSLLERERWVASGYFGNGFKAGSAPFGGGVRAVFIVMARNI
jgi:hypothetical protein